MGKIAHSSKLRSSLQRGAWLTALLFLIAGCVRFVSVSYYHHDGGALKSHSRVVVTPEYVVFSPVANKIRVYRHDGSLPPGAPNEQTLAAAVVSMAAAPNRTFWTLTNSGTRVRRVQLNTSGQIASQSAGFVVPTSVDLAVSPDGTSIYVVTASEIRQYSTTGTFLNGAGVPLGTDLAVFNHNTRVSVDPTTGFVFVGQNVTLVPEARLGIRITRWGSQLGSPTHWARRDPSDGHRTLHDLEAAEDLVAVNRGTGANVTTLDIYWSGTAQTALLIDHASLARVSTLGWGGRAMPGVCGGSKQGGYIWRARTNVPYTMLARHLVCEN